MNFIQLVFKVLKKTYNKISGHSHPPILPREMNPDKASEMIYNLLAQDSPCMIARFGAFELATIVNYLGVRQGRPSLVKYIKGEALDWTWNERLLQYMNTNAGFFPPTHDATSRFCELMLADMGEVDLLGSWIPDEYYVKDYIKNARITLLRLLEPFWSKHPWTKVLKGKKVLVVHPFASLIEHQYVQNRDKLFSNPDILPCFELQTIQAVQSLGGETKGFSNWFDALNWMKAEIDKRDYDICLIGCGAYGFPLAAHVKRQGKKAIHLGGALQLLFGIRGKRWEDPNYGVKEWGIPYGSYSSLMNDYWVRPGEGEKPKNADKVEGACYW